MYKQSVFNPQLLEGNIKFLLQKHKINQNKLASVLYISQSSFNKRLKGHVPFTIGEIYAIAKLFRVSIDELCCKDISTGAAEPQLFHKNDFELSPLIDVLQSICTALATIFKYSYVETHPVTIAEDILIQDICISEYKSIFFPNYRPICKNFDSNETAEIIRSKSKQNYLINSFLKELTDLYTAYRNKNIEHSDYQQSIDNALKRFLNVNKKNRGKR